jgi:hypothetical protein
MLTTVCAFVSLLAPGALSADPPEVVIPPDRKGPSALTAKEQKRINKAIDRGIAYLRRTQLPTGIFADASPCMRTNACSFASLPGLALLESGVAKNDPAVQAASGLVRNAAGALTGTYDISLAILFLDRLGEARDRALVRSLALRLVAGQNSFGGWSYECPLLSRAREKALLNRLGTLEAKAFQHVRYRDKLPPSASRTRPVNSRYDTPPSRGDNSNTQFAILALGAARSHDLPLGTAIARIEQRFRSTQQADGWGYYCWALPSVRTTACMTCVGLLALALGRTAGPDVAKPQRGASTPADIGIQLGLWALGRRLNERPVWRSGGGFRPDYYYLWSVERVGVLCGVKTLGGTDWYRWGCEYLMPAQTAAGSWAPDPGLSCGDSPVVATSMALLFLKRSDLLPDLRKELYKRVRIVDPGPFPKGSLAKKARKGSKGSHPPDWKRLLASTLDDGSLAVDLGKIKSGKPVEKPLRVRGPAAFRIIGIRGGDKQLKVQADSLPATVHNLTVTLQPDKAGPLERTIYLQTDLPGRSEVAVRVRATATPATGR